MLYNGSNIVVFNLPFILENWHITDVQKLFQINKTYFRKLLELGRV